MVSFRKLFLVVAILAAVAGLASAAPATTIITCGGQAGPTSVLRAEGVAELVGAISLGTGCTTANPQAVGDMTKFTIQVFTSNNVQVTSVTHSDATTNEPVLVLSNTLTHAAITTVHGTVSGNSITFSDFSIPTDGAVVGMDLTLNGLRVNASQIPSGSSMGVTVLAASNDPSLTGASSAIFQIPGSPNSPYVSIPNVAVALNSLTTSAKTYFHPDDNNAYVKLQPCLSDTDFDPTKSEAVNSGHLLAVVTFSAVTSNAFVKPVPGDGLDKDTRITLSITNVPAGVTLYVPTVPAVADIDGTGTATLFVGYDANFANGYAFNATNSTATYLALTPDSTGTASAVYVLTGFGQVANNKVRINVYESTDTPTAASAPSVLSAGYAPLAAASAVPRFNAGGSILTNMFQFSPCTSEVLFPYVVAGNGYDTGLAISNIGASAKDPSQSLPGTCTVTFYGAGAPAAYTTPSAVPAAQTTAFSILAQYPTASFSGYAVAICNFTGAAGYGFVANKSGSTASYLPPTLDGASGK